MVRAQLQVPEFFNDPHLVSERFPAKSESAVRNGGAFPIFRTYESVEAFHFECHPFYFATRQRYLAFTPRLECSDSTVRAYVKFCDQVTDGNQGLIKVS